MRVDLALGPLPLALAIRAVDFDLINLLFYLIVRLQALLFYRFAAEWAAPLIVARIFDPIVNALFAKSVTTGRFQRICEHLSTNRADDVAIQ